MLRVLTHILIYGLAFCIPLQSNPHDISEGPESDQDRRLDLEAAQACLWESGKIWEVIWLLIFYNDPSVFSELAISVCYNSKNPKGQKRLQ